LQQIKDNYRGILRVFITNFKGVLSVLVETIMLMDTLFIILL